MGWVPPSLPPKTFFDQLSPEEFEAWYDNECSLLDRGTASTRTSQRFAVAVLAVATIGTLAFLWFL